MNIMKNKRLVLLMQSFFMFAIFTLVLVSCKKDPIVEDPIASFQYEISTDNYLEVTFTNYSQNATTYSWDFDDSQTSTDENPTHVYTTEGTYTVALTASNADGASSTFSETIKITDPNTAYKLLTGEVSKTWKLYRVGTSMSLGESADNPANWWDGLTNDGARPCLYNQEFTFHFDGTYVFNDNGWFWGEYGVFNGTSVYETCFEAIASNMINQDGIDVSAWLSGTHSFTYDVSGGTASLNGLGAWIGIPKLGPTGETSVPFENTTFNISITEETGYDLMTIGFDYADAGYWTIVYVNYSDLSLEPEVVTVEQPFGEDLPNLTPTEMWNTFETLSSFVVLDTAAVYPGTGVAANGVTFSMGVTDPAAGGTNVGQYDRWGQYQELQFMMENDIQFDNFTTVSIDVYVPSTNDYSGDLTKAIAIIIGEASQTEEWWTGHVQYDVDPVDVVLDTWQTWTFQLDSPTSGSGYSPLDRTDLDFFAISIGGGGHTAAGTFYVRNFEFN